MTVETITYKAGSVTAKGALIYDDKAKGKRPLMLVSPNWMGMAKDSIARVERMAGDKYIAFLADMYGDGLVTAPPACVPLANELRENPKERRARIRAALDTLVAESTKRGIGDTSKKVAVGFCFGGGNVLELARDGADIAAAICIHGDLITPMPAKAGDIKAAICILHGAADPVVPKDHRDKVEAEMTAAGVKWQMLTFGHLLHSFSEEGASVPNVAKYDPGAARQVYNMIDDIASAAFAGKL
jgi:dienelactone hydrolase